MLRLGSIHLLFCKHGRQVLGRNFKHICYTGDHNMILTVLVLLCISLCYSREIPRVTKSSLGSARKHAKCTLVYVESDEKSSEVDKTYHKFVTVAQNFKNNKDIFFARIADMSFVADFQLDAFPAIVYYEYESDDAKEFKNILTVETMLNLVEEAMHGHLDPYKRQYVLELTKDNIRGLLYNPEQYRLVMVHEEEDTDDVDIFQEIAKTYDNDNKLLIARIDIDKQKSLEKEYKSIIYPYFLWYRKGAAAESKRYGGDLDPFEMLKFINKETGIRRMPGGGLDPTNGLNQQMDDIIIANIADIVSANNLDPIIEKMTKVKNSLKTSVANMYADVYVRCVQKVKEISSIDAVADYKKVLLKMSRTHKDNPGMIDVIRKFLNVVDRVLYIIGKHYMGSVPEVFKDFYSRHETDEKIIKFRGEL